MKIFETKAINPSSSKDTEASGSGEIGDNPQNNLYQQVIYKCFRSGFNTDYVKDYKFSQFC